ncbi:MAG: DnaT-like ssDNA-binding domain-containing protein [Saccharospirillum sp.]
MIPEKVLVVSPALAETLGLEEALLYQLLSELALLKQGSDLHLTEAHRARLLPFWTPAQLSAVLRRLQAQGVLTVQGSAPWQITIENLADPVQAPSAPARDVPAEQEASVQRVPVYGMNDARRRNQMDDDLAYLKPEPTPQRSVRAERTRMHAHWEPSEDFPKLLSFHDIPLTFALSELGKFRQYYQDKDRAEYSWDVRFLNWVQRAWHDQLNSKGRHERYQSSAQEPANTARDKRSKVRAALRNIQDTDW